VRAAVSGVASAIASLLVVSVDESENTPLSEQVGVIISGTWGCIWGCGGGVELWVCDSTVHTLLPLAPSISPVYGGDRVGFVKTLISS